MADSNNENHIILSSKLKKLLNINVTLQNFSRQLFQVETSEIFIITFFIITSRLVKLYKHI